MSGMDRIPLRIPEKWDPVWFATVLRDVFALADVRNAVAGTGISISGQPDEVATIAASDDVLALTAASLLTATPSLLTNARQLVSGHPSIQIVDWGAGEVVTVSVPQFGLTLDRIAQIPALSILASQALTDPANIDVVQSSSDDTLLRRVSDSIDWGQLTAGMFPASLSITTALTVSGQVLLNGFATVFTSTLQLESGAPVLSLFENDGPTNEKFWKNYASNGQLRFVAQTDAEGGEVRYLTVDRTGTSIDGINLHARTFINPDPQTPPANSVNADAQLVLVNDGAISIEQLVIGGGSLGYRFVGASGTFGTPAATNPANQSYIGYLGAGGFDGTNWQTGGAGLIGMRPTAVWSSSQRPIACVFETTDDSSTTRVERCRVKPGGQVRFVPLASAPTTYVEDGDVYYDSGTGKLRVRAGGAWTDLH